MRPLPNQRRGDHDLRFTRAFALLVKIYDGKGVAIPQMGLANRLQVFDRARGLRSAPGDVEAERIFASARFVIVRHSGVPLRDLWSRRRNKVKIDEEALRVRQIPNKFPDRCRQFPNERWDRKNPVNLRQFRILHQINDLEAVAAEEVLFAKLPQISQSQSRSWSMIRDVKPKRIRARRLGFFKSAFCSPF